MKRKYAAWICGVVFMTNTMGSSCTMPVRAEETPIQKESQITFGQDDQSLTESDFLESEETQQDTTEAITEGQTEREAVTEAQTEGETEAETVMESDTEERGEEHAEQTEEHTDTSEENTEGTSSGGQDREEKPEADEGTGETVQQEPASEPSSEEGDREESETESESDAESEPSTEESEEAESDTADVENTGETYSDIEGSGSFAEAIGMEGSTGVTYMSGTWPGVWEMQPDFRFTQVEKRYAIVENYGGAVVYEGQSEDSGQIGEIPEFGMVCVLETEENGWTYIESGRVRGFIRTEYLSKQEFTDLLVDSIGEDSFTFGTISVDVADNDAFTYTHTTTQDVLAEKRYGLLLIDTPIYEYQQETARAIGAAASGNLVYILQELGNGWCFVESGDVRGFTRRSNILLGDTAEDTVKMMGEEKVTLAEELIEPEENRSCYFTLTSTKLASDGMGEEIAKTALTYVGNLPYIWGGTSLEAGADCSGFVQGVYASKGINIPRLAEEQGVSGILISSLSEAKPGDIVYWASGPHVGIYIGDGKVIQCSGDSSNTWGNPGKGVTISNVDYMPITSIRRYLVTAGADNGSFAKDRSGYSQAELELIWAIVAQEDNGSYEGALAVISSAMNRTESSSWSYLGSNVLSQLTASGQYCYSLDNYWKGRLHGNVPDYVKQAVYDCLHKGIRNHKYTSFRSQNGAASNYSAVQIGGNWFFGS